LDAEATRPLQRNVLVRRLTVGDVPVARRLQRGEARERVSGESVDGGRGFWEASGSRGF